MEDRLICLCGHPDGVHDAQIGECMVMGCPCMKFEERPKAEVTA